MEHLNAVVDAVADVEQVVSALHDAVRRRKVLRDHPRLIWTFDRRAALRPVWRTLAVRAPVPLVLPRLRVEHDDTPIAIAVRDKDFIALRIDDDARGTGEAVGVIA